VEPVPSGVHGVGTSPRLRRARAACTLAALAVAAPCAAASGPPVVFLGNRNIAPVVYVEDGAPAGVAVDLVRALAPHLSRPVEVRALDWTVAQALVFRGEADALVQMNPSDERRKQYDFSGPLLESRFSIFVRRDSLAVPGAAGLRGLTVGVEAGGLPEQVLGRDPAVRLVRIPDFLTGFGLLAAYDLDAVVVDWRVGSYVLATHGIRGITVTGDPIATSWSAIAVKKGNAALLAELDAALGAIRADGTYDRILERWRPKEVVFWTRRDVVRGATIAGVVGVVLLLLSTGLWMLALRRELRRRRAAEATLAARNAVMSGIINGADTAIYSLDRAYRYTSCNAAHAAAMKAIYGVDAAVGRSALDGVPAPDRDDARALFDRALAGERVTTEVWAGAARRYLRVSHDPIRGEDGAVQGVAVLAQDLTDRKLSEELVRRMNRELRALTSSNKILLRATDEVTLLREVCRVVVDEAGYRMAWVGLAEADAGRTIRPVAWAGVEDGYLTAAQLTWADVPRGHGPAGTAVRTGATACVQDFAVDSSAAPWRAEAVARGYRSSAALPLQDARGHTFGVLCIYATEPGAFTPDERRLVEELAGDVALGVDVLRARAELERAERQRAAHLHFLESMDRVNRAITGSSDLEQMMRDVLDVVLAVLDCDRAFLMYPCDPSAPTWTTPMERCRPEYPGVQALGLHVPMDPEVAESLRILLASDAPVRIGPGTPHALPGDVAERFGIRSFLAVAIRPRTGKPWLFGVHQCSRVRTWTVDEEWLIQEIGRRLADALSTLLAVRDLRESEARLAKAERMVHVGYWDLDVRTSRMQLSEEACRIFGVPAEQRTWDLDAWRARWRTLGEPAERARADAAITEAVAAGRPGFDVEFRLGLPGGDVRWVHGQGEITRGADGTPLRVLTTVQDVTERKRAEEALRRSEDQYRRIVETTHEGIWLIDAAGRTTFVNRQLAEMLRCPVEELRGAPLTDFLDEEDQGIVGPDLARRAAPGNPHEVRFLRRDGTDLWALVELTPFFDEGVATGALAMVTDVTERRAIEAQLRQSQKLEAVGRLAGGVAHDFNNLLTAILSDAQELADGLGPDNPLRTEATEIEAAARKAALLTRQLLAFGRKQRSEPRVVDVREVLAAMDRMLRRLIGEDVELTTVVSPDLGRIRVDPVQLEQVLLNLAVNSRDAMPGGGRLAIEATNVDRQEPDAAPGTGARWVRVAVRDSGLGMSPEVQAHLFEPFFTTKEPGKGTGLGLATVYGIVQQAGGEVRVRSETGKGTSFEVLFPRFDGPADAAAAPAPRERTRGAGRVLVVEDEPLVRALAVRVLRAAGYEVLEAGDAEQALALAGDRGGPPVDLLVTDVVMPRCSGPELAHRLRAARPALPVLFASGYMDRAQDLERELGPRTAFIPKPFTPDQLARAARELLDGAGATAADPLAGTRR
jgi:PAS domain S-box-containing protein